MKKRFGIGMVIMLMCGCLVMINSVWSEEEKEQEEQTDQAEQLAGTPDKDKKEEKKDEKKDDTGQEVVIRGVQRLKVKAEKPDPDVNFDVDEIAVPYVTTEDSLLDVSPTTMAYPAVSIPAELNAPQAASPYIQLFQRPPILTLNPRYSGKANIAKWRLRITDGLGNVFKDYSGQNSLPESIVWDGMGVDNKTMVDVGTSYSYIFSIVDVASNPTSQIGKPIVLESLLYEKNEEITAKVMSDVLFEKKDRGSEISKKGALYLKEIADLLAERQKYPLIIESYSKDVDDASYRGELIQKHLEELMVLPKNSFKVEARKSRLAKVVFLLR